MIERCGGSPPAPQEHLRGMDPGKRVNEVVGDALAGKASPGKSGVNGLEVTACIEFAGEIEVVKDASDRLYDRKTGPGVLFCHASAIIALRPVHEEWCRIDTTNAIQTVMALDLGLPPWHFRGGMSSERESRRSVQGYWMSEQV